MRKEGVDKQVHQRQLPVISVVAELTDPDQIPVRHAISKISDV